MENLLQSGGREVRIRKRHERGTQQESKAAKEEHVPKTGNVDSIALRAQSLLSSMKEDEVVPSTNPANPLDIATPIRLPSSATSSESEDEESPTTPKQLPRKSRQRQLNPIAETNRRSSNPDNTPSISRPLKSTRRRQPLDLSISQATRSRRRGS